MYLFLKPSTKALALVLQNEILIILLRYLFEYFYLTKFVWVQNTTNALIDQRRSFRKKQREYLYKGNCKQKNSCTHAKALCIRVLL